MSALLPLLILLLFISLGHNFPAPWESAGAQEVPFQNNSVPLIVRGLAYLLALGIVLNYFADSRIPPGCEGCGNGSRNGGQKPS